MSFLDFFRKSMPIVDVSAALDYSELPLGFFRVETATGKKALGYNNPSSAFGVSFDVGTTVVVGGKRITLDVERDTLPLVRLHFRSHASGVQEIGGHRFLSTDDMPGEWDGEVGWNGSNVHDIGRL